MLEKLIYRNHLNEDFEFGQDGIFVDSNDLHDYTWKASTKGTKIVSFSREVQTRKLPVTIICDNESDAIAAKNRLHEVAEKDILSLKPGKIIIGDYYFQCYITGSAKSEYLLNKRLMKAELELTSDQSYWIRESTTNFNNESANTDGYNYPGDYPFNYSSGTKNTELDNRDFVPSNFKLIIYGAIVNPAVTVNGHEYKVNCSVQTGEYLTIDSISKKIFLTGTEGEITNKFSNRSRDSYIFEKMPSGKSVVAWDGDFDFDIILMEERSEPKWI